MTERRSLRIPGRPRPGDRPLETLRSPYTQEVLAQVEQATEADLSHALDLQARLFADRDGWLPPHQRIGILERAARLMEDRADALALGIAREGGKPLTDAAVEVARAVAGMKILAAEVGRLHGEEIPMGATAPSTGRLAFTTREPIGPVAAVSAFNHPVNLIVHQAGAAVAAGCPVIVKPATVTPLSCMAVVDILHEAGLPPEWCIALPCSNRVAEKLVTSDQIAFFSFIGSAKVGWYLRSRLAPGVRCALEHGGAAPVLVDDGADLDRVVPSLLKGGLYHAGQVCVSVQRVFADVRIKDELVARLAEGMARWRTGDPTLAETESGPLIRPAEVDRVHAWVGETVSSGARLACGGAPMDHNCYAPTLLVDPSDQAPTMRNEVFGPVVNVSGAESLAEAMARANALEWAFQAAVFTPKLETALTAVRGLDAAAVMVNDHTAFRVDWMPFGGRKASGLGVGGMAYSMHDLTQHKLVVLQL